MEDDEMDLPPGFRFHPTDEELITHYLSQKVLDSYFCAKAIGEIDLNKCEPWDLPWKAKIGEKEWYFFCVRDRKYPTGLRTNRATDAGYWKATGKDKEIYRAKSLVGMKKTLVFYRGRAPKGEKSNWVMHEYRLEGKYSYDFSRTARNEWVICRVFQKTAAGKKTHISGIIRMNTTPTEHDEPMNPFFPPLMGPSSFKTRDSSGVDSSEAVLMNQLEMNDNFSSSIFDFSPSSTVPYSLHSDRLLPPSAGISCPLPTLPFVPAASGIAGGLRMMKEMNASVIPEHTVIPAGLEDPMKLVNSGGAVDLDCLWNY